MLLFSGDSCTFQSIVLECIMGEFVTFHAAIWVFDFVMCFQGKTERSLYYHRSILSKKV